ncbi:MAG: putative monovalent cation/H+ antiporter subunit [Ramlibacter sp.]|jgi:multicomponent K+:H+ antiporter subunit E|uniref:Na+/H+ antiporter subunit E n=1 Tax=Ramlibacter sp. TaxID=1917967 RepID=UPI0026358FEE|nr:Na+/H+ antiporter subunit E [Ramlibacter sp.]MDB5751427.1 putative monovalent cation/H+ antiporter subunit [Ramlibacter sp.]
MKRWLPSPLLSLALFAMWLMLNRSLSAGHLLLGAAAGLVMPWLLRRLQPAGRPLRHPLVLCKLVLVVGGDVVRSALDVGWGVLRSGHRPPRGAFVTVPLQLRDARALAALAVITTVVPGTVWCELAPDRSALLLHVYDLDGEAEFIRHFKDRYERPLKEIFE